VSRRKPKAPESLGAVTTGPGWELRRGRWQDVLADVEVDAVICDPPYGARTHDPSVSDGTRYDGATVDGIGPAGHYEGWTADDVLAYVRAWSPRCRGWMVSLTSHDLGPAWEAAYESVGRYPFAPVPCVMRGMSVRLLGDGPSSWAVYAMVARPRTKDFATWGTLPGAYVGPRGDEAGGGRGKPDWLMSAIVRDYTRPGSLIADPFAGWGSTFAAAVGNGRTAIGSEMDADAYAEAVRRLRRPIQVDMLSGLGGVA
jgi:hypothetical protein